jgi:acyl dehydratase
VTLDDYLGIGEAIELGEHVFSAEAIKAFARLYDPQPFHVDEALAAGTVFGGLCASGWHTAAVWMRLNLRHFAKNRPEWTGAGPEPSFGPSPGFENMRWPKPVYAGETVRYFRTATAHRRLASRPGWRIVSLRGHAVDSKGDAVLDFDGGTFLKAN